MRPFPKKIIGIKYLLLLPWKAFLRSAAFGKGVALKLFVAFMALYFAASLVFFGSASFGMLKKIYPGTDPLLVVSGFMPYWILGELLLRSFLQKLPTLQIKPLLLLPYKKGGLVHFVLIRSAFSFFNILAFFYFIPFAITLANNRYDPVHIGFWLAAIAGIVLTLNYLNLAIGKSDRGYIFILALIVLFIGLDQFGLYDIRSRAEEWFFRLFANPRWVLVPLLTALLAYVFDFLWLRKRLFLGDSFGGGTSQGRIMALAWTDRMGPIAPYLRLDLRLFWRNKRTRGQLFVSLLFALYGLFFYGMEQFSPTSAMLVFSGIFMTGSFLINFGQFIPAWDSTYYELLMAQNLRMDRYLGTKALLIAGSVIFMFLLTLPYVYFGWHALAINLACVVYNIGVNVPMILLFGALNKKRIDLEMSPLSNMQGTGLAQFLVGIPLFGLPMILYFPVKTWISFEWALGLLTFLGVLGILFWKPMLQRLALMYTRRKYGMIKGFKQKGE